MKTIVGRKIQEMVDSQINLAVARREFRRVIDAKVEYCPVITISREPCAGGTTLGRSIAERLGFACWDQELLTRIAEKTGAIEQILASVDERVHSFATEFVRTLLLGFEYTQDDYRAALTKVIGTIASQGSAVVVGRGGHLILGPSRCLRVRVVCPLEQRVARMTARDGITESHAARRIRNASAELAAFMRHHFRMDGTDPSRFDVIVNSGMLDVAEATEIVVSTYIARFGQVRVPERSERPPISRTPIENSAEREDGPSCRVSA